MEIELCLEHKVGRGWLEMMLKLPTFYWIT